MYPDLDRFRELPDSEPSQETVALEGARFIDRVEPENENLWHELIEKAHEAEMSLDDFAIPLWMDETIPNAVRDRALLLMVGNANTKKVTGGWNGSLNMGFALYGFNMYSIKSKYPEFDFEKFKQWLEEAKNYELQNCKIINDKLSWRQTYAYFDLGIYDQDQFEQALEEFNWQEVSPNLGGTGWNGDSYDLDPKRFPYLDDIFKGETTDSPVLKRWARKKLMQFINTEDHERHTLPNWMQAASNDSVKSLLWPIYAEWAADRGEFDDILLSAFEKYGWEFLLRKRGSNHYIGKLLDKLPTHLQVSLIEWTLVNYRNDETHLTTSEIIDFKKRAENLWAVGLFTLIKECLEKSTVYDTDQERKKVKREQKWKAEREKDPREIEKRQAQDRYRALLVTIRNAEKFNQ